MAHPQKTPLRALTAEERSLLQQIARSPSEPAGHVARAKALLAVAAGAPFTHAAHAAGRRSGDGVALLVARFNRQGLAALARQPGGGPPTASPPSAPSPSWKRCTPPAIPGRKAVPGARPAPPSGSARRAWSR